MNLWQTRKPPPPWDEIFALPRALPFGGPLPEARFVDFSQHPVTEMRDVPLSVPHADLSCFRGWDETENGSSQHSSQNSSQRFWGLAVQSAQWISLEMVPPDGLKSVGMRFGMNHFWGWDETKSGSSQHSS